MGRRQKGIYKRKGSDFWQLRYVGLDGKLHRESSETTVYKVADEKLTEIKSKLNQNEEPEKKIGNYNFEQLVKAYKADYLQGTPSEGVKGSILDSLLERTVVSDDTPLSLQHLPLRKFSTRLVERLQKDIQAEGYTDAYNNKIMNTLKHSFTKAVDWLMVSERTRKELKKVKLFDEPGRLRYLSAQEASNLISVCNSNIQPIVRLALYTGMRSGEILGLKWEQVDLQHGFIHLPKTKNGERRDIPINNDIRSLFNSIHRFFVGEKDNKKLLPYVFTNPETLKPFTDIKRSFRKALKIAGITDYRFHDNRHTYASQYMMNGGDLFMLSKLLGHKNIKQTMKYAHFAPQFVKQAAKVTEGIYNLTPEQIPVTAA